MNRHGVAHLPVHRPHLMATFALLGIAGCAGSAGSALDEPAHEGDETATEKNDTIYGQTVTSLTQYGVTWTFTSPEIAGQFINGDYWVLDDGDVVLQSVTPAPEGGRHGSMLNPEVGGQHAFDDWVRAGYDASLAAQFPLEVHGGDALISTISRANETTDWAGQDIDSKAQTKTAAVLTIVTAIPPQDAFRPAYVDRSQTMYRTNQIDHSAVPALSTQGVVFTHDLAYYERALQRPWITFVYEWPGRDSHPFENMNGYHQRVGELLSEACLMLLLDLPAKETLLIRYLQLAIDYYHVGLGGHGDSAFYVAPVIIGGLFLGDDAMRTAFVDRAIISVPRDYPDFYFYEDRNDDTTSSIVPAGQTYSGHTVFFRNNLGANRGFEHLHPSEWVGDAAKDDSYRINQDTHQHVGMVLAASILQLREEWAHEPTFAMIQRWMVDADPTAEQALIGSGPVAVKSSRSGFVDSLFEQHWSY